MSLVDIHLAKYCYKWVAEKTNLDKYRGIMNDWTTYVYIK